VNFPFPDQVVVLDYTNWRGERSERLIWPLYIHFANSNWHKEFQWLLVARDLAKGQNREFALKDVHGWHPQLPPKA
jgi:predicted DNA-binding transcriptional regulator YafY